MMASGVYLCCAERGLTVGRDISVFGYDNLSLSQALDPPLSTVESPLDEMGRRSAALVLDQLREKDAGTPKEWMIPCKLHMRASLGQNPNC